MLFIIIQFQQNIHLVMRCFSNIDAHVPYDQYHICGCRLGFQCFLSIKTQDIHQQLLRIRKKCVKYLKIKGLIRVIIHVLSSNFGIFKISELFLSFNIVLTSLKVCHQHPDVDDKLLSMSSKLWRIKSKVCNFSKLEGIICLNLSSVAVCSYHVLVFFFLSIKIHFGSLNLYFITFFFTQL